MSFHLTATAALALAACSYALAADTGLVFDLRPNEATVTTTTARPTPRPAPKPVVKAPAPRSVQRPAPSSRPTRSSLASRQSAAGTLVGRIGHIVVYGAPIYDGPQQTKVYNRCNVGQPVILVGYNSQWYGVRMIDGRTGYVLRNYVRLSEASIRLPEAPVRPAPSRPNAYQYATGGVNPLLYTAFGYMGIPYKWGGTSASGIDCSGFVQSVFRQYGAKLPRVARDQAKVGISVPPSPEHLRPGDRLYFAAHHKYIDHTGIYWGNGLMIHSSGGRGVDITPLWDGGIYERSLVSARRTFAPIE